MKGTLAPGVNEMEVSSITAAELSAIMKGSEAPLLLDVREAAELKGDLGRLEQIVHIPIASLSHRLKELITHKGKPIVTVCRSGGRAHTAAQILKQAGFPECVSLRGE